MPLSEKLLLLLSRKPGTSDYAAGHDHWTVDNALEKLCVSFPDFMEMIRGKDILDYGCGEGYQSVAMAKSGARHVLGVEINSAYRERASRLAAANGVQDRAQFAESCGDNTREKFDVVISHNSMEHFCDPEKSLGEMKAALKRDGRLLITFGCPWLSPYGSHMHFFCKVPWLNILFRERTVMNVRERFIVDGARHYEEVQGGLNRMTVAKFERLVTRIGLRIASKRYWCVKGLNFLGPIPVIRELFVNDISVVLAGNRGGSATGVPARERL
jgi:SAM-dependent methyltransferase